MRDEVCAVACSILSKKNISYQECLELMSVFKGFKAFFVHSIIKEHQTIKAFFFNYIKGSKAFFIDSISHIKEQFLFTCSLSEYADLHGHLSERRIWGMLIDLLKVYST